MSSKHTYIVVAQWSVRDKLLNILINQNRGHHMLSQTPDFPFCSGRYIFKMFLTEEDIMVIKLSIAKTDIYRYSKWKKYIYEKI